jgi:hypothetical protein
MSASPSTGVPDFFNWPWYVIAFVRGVCAMAVAAMADAIAKAATNRENFMRNLLVAQAWCNPGVAHLEPATGRRDLCGRPPTRPLKGTR